ncbi:SRPBCC domain-containing protein [Patescibacteria group bacterium]|nr:SRPBCC domain-containing protein [Patescibacteria group bacterium]
MQKIHFSILINAPREKVWDILVGEDSYPQWTSAFSPGSYFKGSWEEGSKILFLGPNPDGTGEGGMVSRIKENRLHEFVSIEHLGTVANGVEDTTSEEAKKWAPAYESYAFVDKDGGTEVSIDMDTLDEYKTMFEEMWPKALQALKDLAEK